MQDAELVFTWRNAPETRQFFFDTRPLNKHEHIKWFEQSLTMPNRCILIAESDKNSMGVLRYDLTDTTAEIDIYLQPGLAGQGLGTQILLAGTQWINTNYPLVNTLRARVIAENTPSKRAFEKAGFHTAIYIYEKKIGAD